MHTDTIANIATILFFATIIAITWYIFIGQYTPLYTNDIDRENAKTIEAFNTSIEGFIQNNIISRSDNPDIIPNTSISLENLSMSDEDIASRINPEVITEMARQLETIDAADRHLARDQMSQYIANPDIVRNYRAKTEEMLTGLQQQIDKHSTEKRKQLERLNTYLLNLQEFIDADFVDRQRRRRITSIKSHNNGQELAVIPVNTTTGRINNGHYRISINGGCMKVPENNNYDVVPRNPDDAEQIFRLEMIYNDTNYRNALAPGFPQLSTLGKVHYPFAILRATSNSNCLRNHHGRLSVEPLREHEGQRWGVLEETKLPKCMN